MTLIQNLKLKNCTISVTTDDATKIVVSAGAVEINERHRPGPAEVCLLTDAVEYLFLPAEIEDRITYGYLVYDTATDEVDVFVEELYRDTRVLVHDWKADTGRILLACIFVVEVYRDGPPRVILWTPGGVG